VRSSAACQVKAVKEWLAYFEISRTAQRPPIVSSPRTHETIRRSNETSAPIHETIFLVPRNRCETSVC
jgi:hypothetical protein